MTIADLGLYLLIYAFLGWAAEAFCYGVVRRGFYNRGFFSAPLLPSYGITFVILILVLPRLEGRYVLQFVFTLIISSVIETLSTWLTRWLVSGVRWGEEGERLQKGKKGLVLSALIALGYYLTYLLLHPLLWAGAVFLPELLKEIVVAVLLGLLALDLVISLWAFRTGEGTSRARRQARDRGRLAAWISNAVWRRLHKAYPGIGTEEEGKTYTFAKGLCLDKLLWVFLTTALLGDLIETLYCGLVDKQWMSRSSVLYGPFSFVWGLGAVVLTITLQRLADKPDRYIFLAGFVIGGVYEYVCSVFTELVFGTVFWDYSHMALNIGGRTNVLFCFFWGVLALVWVKAIYPIMSRTIEKLPPLAGKVITWVLVLLMVCNTLLTGAAMLRYQSRADRPESANPFEAFLDQQYGDDFMEGRWPNMVVAEALP